MPITGCFLSWIAVGTSDQRRVIDLLGLTPGWPATFPLGIAAADLDGHRHGDRDGAFARVFITPPLDGWTLLVGPWCDPADEERRDEVLELCVGASAVFGNAQAYWYGAQGDGSAWLIAENGTLIGAQPTSTRSSKSRLRSERGCRTKQKCSPRYRMKTTGTTPCSTSHRRSLAG